MAITGDRRREYVLIRTEALTLVDPTVTEGSAAAALAASGAEPAVRRRHGRIGAPAAPASSASPAGPPLRPRRGARRDRGRRRLRPRHRRAGEHATDPSPAFPRRASSGRSRPALQDRFGRIDEVRQQDSVGAVVSSELIQQTFLLILMASLAIMAWITYRFRDFRMGVTAIVALLHDVIVTVGVFALLGTFIDLQIDALFVTAMLTVIGFSVHDTIVVFDRVRENRRALRGRAARGDRQLQPHADDWAAASRRR